MTENYKDDKDENDAEEKNNKKNDDFEVKDRVLKEKGQVFSDDGMYVGTLL